jgi:uncharacterized membrane protein
VTKERGAARKVATWLLEVVGVLVFAVVVAMVGTWLGMGRAEMKIIVFAVIVGLVVLVSLPEFLRPWPKGRHKKPPP